MESTRTHDEADDARPGDDRLGDYLVVLVVTCWASAFGLLAWAWL